MQREFATNAAHELRTPLASIVTAVEMLQTGAKDEPATRDEFLGMIERESGRLTRLTRALLVLARAGARDELPNLGVVQVEPLLEQVAASLPRRPGVEVGVDCPSLLAIVGDADLLEQALSSIAQNAVQHTDAGRVTMRGRRENGHIVIEVADTGSGIPASDQARIFDRFYRAGDRDGGFGLGLSIAREAVRTLGGEIELESEQTVGTTVRITLQPAPASRAGARTGRGPDPGAGRAGAPPPRPPASTHSMPPPAPRSPRRSPPQPKEIDVSPRILVVDDEPSLVRGLTYALERDKFEVEAATDGEAAVDAALTQAIDLVILDLMLPKLSGEEACKPHPGRERRADHHAHRQGLRTRPAERARVRRRRLRPRSRSPPPS